MGAPVRITDPLLDVLEVFLAAAVAGQELHGWAIMKAVRRAGPTVYGVLDRLEDAGWITGRWDERTAEPNKPRRRYYRLTAAGSTSAGRLMVERRPDVSHRSRGPRPGWVWPSGRPAAPGAGGTR